MVLSVQEYIISMPAELAGYGGGHAAEHRALLHH